MPIAPSSLQLIGSKALGGAERWFIRFVGALCAIGAPPAVGIRRGGALEGLDLGPAPIYSLGFHTTWDPWSRAEVGRLIAALRPALVQTYLGRATRLTQLSMGGGVVHIARLGGYYALGPYRHAHAWIGNTRGLCDYLVRNGLPAQRVFHIYNFVEPPPPVPSALITRLRIELGLPAAAWVLMTPGRLVAVKGHRFLIEALGRLPAEIAGRPLWLVLLGEGPLGGALRRQADQAGVGGRIIWAGWRQDPSPFYELADLVVFPSLDAETLGNVMLEAWAQGRPLVTTQFRGAQEIAHPGEDAWCVPCANPTALAEGIRLLLQDPALARALGAAGRQRVLTSFSRSQILHQYLDLYNRLTGA